VEMRTSGWPSLFHFSIAWTLTVSRRVEQILMDSECQTLPWTMMAFIVCSEFTRHKWWPYFTSGRKNALLCLLQNVSSALLQCDWSCRCKCSSWDVLTNHVD